MNTIDADIVIVGGGPAGIAAACRAAESKRRVHLLDANPSLGGQIWRAAQSSKKSKAGQWIERFARSGAQLLAGREVIGLERTDVLRVALSNGQAELISYRRLLIATGAREMFLPLPGWTLPGFMGAGGLQALVKNGLPIAGKKVIVAGSGPLLLAVAATLTREGARVVLIAEQAPMRHIIFFGGYLLRRHFSKFREAIGLRRASKGIPYRTGCWLSSIQGRDRVQRVTISNGNRQWSEQCDYVACGFGLTPNLELPMLLGCTVRDNRAIVNSLQQTNIENIYCDGEVAGIGGLETALAEGQIAGLAMSDKQSECQRLFAERDRQRHFAERLQAAFKLRNDLRRLADPQTMVCRCEDVSLDRLRLFASWREAKLQSRCGMGACQGRICGPACEFLLGWKTDSVRPPLFPCSVQQFVDDSIPARRANEC